MGKLASHKSSVVAAGWLMTIGCVAGIDDAHAHVESAQIIREALEETPVAAPSVREAPSGIRTRVALGDRDKVLGSGWRSSSDRAWTLVGSRTGVHVLVGKENAGYEWRVAATLGEMGFDTDSWIGNACLTGSGRRLVVVYAPRNFTNAVVALHRAGFAAVVDLLSGAVRKLNVTSSLAYFSPGCGTGEVAVLSQFDARGGPRTRLVSVDAAQGAVRSVQIVNGVLTSAVPLGRQVMAVRGSRIVEVVEGRSATKAVLKGPLSRLRVASSRRLVVSETVGGRTSVHVFAAGQRKGRVVASGSRTSVKSHQGSRGRVFITGASSRGRPSMPSGVQIAPGWSGMQVSDGGGLTIRSARRIGTVDRVVIEAVADSGRPVTFVLPSLASVAPTAGRSPVLTSSRFGPTGEADDPVDAGATCAIPRNDVRTQVYQPNPRQVEWAADQAVNNNLVSPRPANWKQSGLPSYTPQLMDRFRMPALAGGGIIPPQVLLGVLAQESNLWQASGHAIETWTGNPLVGNFYGRINNGWNIDFSRADCGYGIGQITDGMRKGDVLWGGPNEQRAIALDYTVNIAAAAKILAEKWNQLFVAGLLVNGARSSRLESWFGAVWAYNSGSHPKAGAGEPWGLGWTNNPMSGLWDPARTPFLEATPADAAHPQDWPYPEKVMGWAAYPLHNPRLGASYRAAWWTDTGGSGSGVVKRAQVKPPLPTFCSLTINACDPSAAHGEHCTRADDKCWWYPPVAWKDCNDTTGDPCGRGLVRFDTTYPEPQPDSAHTPPDPEQNPPICDNSGIPGNAKVIDNVPSGTPSVRPQCTSPSVSAGTFKLRFGATEVNGQPVQYTSKIDFHQVGLGYQGHTWFTHTTWAQTSDQSHTVTGTWTLADPMPGWARVLVHLPERATDTRQAKYLVDRGDGRSPVARYVNTSLKVNKWTSLGVFQLGAGRPSVTLSNRTLDAKYFDSTINPYAKDRQENIAWDAVAFQSLPRKPAIVAAAVGDSYGSGEGAGTYLPGTDHSGSDPLARSACHRSQYAWSRRVRPAVLGGAELGTVSDQFGEQAELNFLSCSGAVAANVARIKPEDLNGNPHYLGGGQHHEVAQLEAGYLDESTDIVFVSLGGNDAKFSDVLNFCISAAAGCYEDTMPGDDTDLDTAERRRIIVLVQLAIWDAMDRIRVAAPNAKIIAAGYPRLFDGTQSHCMDGLSAAELGWMNGMANLMAEKTKATIEVYADETGADVTFVDTRDVFAHHGPCSGLDAINGLRLNKTPGDDPNRPASAESYHPNGAGTRFYADAIETSMGWR